MVFGVILGTALCMVGIFGAIFLIDAIPILKSYDDYVIIAIIVLTLVVLWVLTKKYLVQKSEITLKNDQLIFQRNSKKRELKISDIESYEYKLVQGVRLVIWTRYNEKIVIHANDYFCAHEGLEEFCSAFDEYVNSKKTEKSAASKDIPDVKLSIGVDSERNSGIAETISEVNPNEPISQTQVESKPLGVSQDSKDLTPKRKKSFYEKNYAQPFLIAFTVLLIAFVIYVIVDGGNLPAAIIVSAGGLSAMWAGYFNHQKK